MAKGYWIGRVDVSSDEGYKPYAVANRSDLQEMRWPLRRSGRQVHHRRRASRSRNVVIEFPDYETAIACYNSPEYQANIKVRQPHSIADLIIIEGYDGPQP